MQILSKFSYRANFYRDNGDLTKSYQQLKKAFISDKVNIETKLTILASYLSIVNANDTIKNQAFELVNLLDSLYTNNAEICALYGDLYYATANKELAKKYYKKSVEIKQNIKAVWTQILFLDVEDSNFDSLLIYSEKALMYYPTEPLYYYFNGVAAMQTNKSNAGHSQINFRTCRRKRILIIMVRGHCCRRMLRQGGPTTALYEIGSLKATKTNGFSNVRNFGSKTGSPPKRRK